MAEWRPPNFITEPRIVGHFTRDEADAARFKNGARIRKDVSEPGDATPIGMRGTVLGSVYAPPLGVGYFVEWDDRRGVAVFVIEVKLERAE